VVLSPISTFLAQAFIFNWILKIQMENYLLYLMLGLLPWFFLVQSVEMAASHLQHNGRIVKSALAAPFPLVAAKVVENAVTYFSAFVIGFAALSLLVPGLDFFRIFFLNVFAMIPVLIFTLAIAFLISLMNVLYHDTKFVMTFALGIFFYLTPIIYPRELVPPEFQWLITINPLTYLFGPFREIANGSVQSTLVSMMKSLITAGAAAALAFSYWKGKKSEICSRL